MSRLKVPALVLVVLVLQTSLLARFHVLGVVPDAMLLVSVCAGVVGGRERGAIVGFLAGLAIDLFLPTTPEGLSALVFSLVGYSVGIVGEGTVRAAWWIPVLSATVASAAGEVLFALTASVVAGAELLASRVALVAGLVALMNAVLAPVVLRVSTWAVGQDPVAR